MKNCRRCKEDLDDSKFPSNKTKKDGLSLYCSKCCSKNTMECRNRIKETDPITGKIIYKRKFPSPFKVGSVDYTKDLHFRSNYNITLEEYNILCVKQNNICLICKTVITGLYVDHDHITGKIRGLLCKHCNFGIGHFRDNIEYLKSAILYLS